MNYLTICRYNTEGKRKDIEDGEGSSSEDAEDDEEDKEDDEDEDGPPEEAGGILGASLGKPQAGDGRGRKKKPKAKLASALIWSIPPEKASKKKSNKEEPGSGHHTLAKNSSAGKEKVKGEVVVVRVRTLSEKVHYFHIRARPLLRQVANVKELTYNLI